MFHDVIMRFKEKIEKIILLMVFQVYNLLIIIYINLFYFEYK